MSSVQCESPARVHAPGEPDRDILDEGAAEQAATAWLHRVGQATALVMMSTGAEAVGRAAVQNLHTVAACEGRPGFFFSASGFTAVALEWADVARVPLLRFGLDWVPVPMNAAALAVLAAVV